MLWLGDDIQFISKRSMEGRRREQKRKARREKKEGVHPGSPHHKRGTKNSLLCGMGGRHGAIKGKVTERKKSQGKSGALAETFH